MCFTNGLRVCASASEAVIEGVFRKKKFSQKFLQNSQVDTCAKASFLIKLQATLLKKGL